MADDRKAFIKQQLEAGLRHEAIRRELISQSYGTAGFEEEYNEITAELGITEPKPESNPMSWETTPEPMATGPVPLPSVLATLRAGVVAVRAHLGAITATVVVNLVAIVALALFPSSATPYLDGSLYLAAWAGAVLIFSLLTLVSTMALVYVVIMGETGANFMQGVQWTLARFFSIGWLSFLSGVISLVTFAFLFIPGLVFTLFNSFSFITLVKEDQRGIAAIVRSTDLVRGAVFEVALRLLVLVGITAGVSSIMALTVSMLEPVVPTLPIVGDPLIVPFLILQFMLAVFMVGGLMSVYRARVRAKSFFDRSQYRPLAWLYRILALVGVIVPLALVVLGIVSLAKFLPQTEFSWDEFNDPFSTVDAIESDVNDFVIERRVDTMYESAELQKRRMTNYDGVCQDVLIEAPARCKNTLDELVIYAPLGDGRYYCRDSKGFLGPVAFAPKGTTCR